jgi:APA family basic amino acid/polyamine antiporter
LSPLWFSKINAKTQTPIRATLVIMVIVMALTLYFSLTSLAKFTSSVILAIFALVNMSLWRVKRNKSDGNNVYQGIRIPAWLPLLGGLSYLLTLFFQLWLLIND